MSADKPTDSSATRAMTRRVGPLDLRLARPLARRLARSALASAWAVQHPREQFARRTLRTQSEPRWVLTDDGWDLPLRRIPPAPGASGEPVVLAAELGQGLYSLDAMPDRSLARALHKAGYDVWLFQHRGTPTARPPVQPDHCDLDAVATHDIPAMLDRIRGITGAHRVHWLGHGMGAQGALVYLAQGGDRVCSLIAIGAPVRFPKASTRARLVGRVAESLPAQWRVPLGTVADALAPGPGARLLHPLAASSTALDRRTLLLHGTQAVRCGMIRQAAMCFEQGHLTDRTGTVDYVLALKSCRTPMLLIGAEGDPLCPPGAMRSLLGPAQRTMLTLDAHWSHFDPLVAPSAQQDVYRPICEWLEGQRASSWAPLDF